MKKALIGILLFISINTYSQDVYKIISVNTAIMDTQKNEWHWNKFKDAVGTIAFKDGLTVITLGERAIYLKVGKIIASENKGSALGVTWKATDQDNQLLRFKKVVDSNAKYDYYAVYYRDVAICWLTEQHKINN